MPHSHLPSSKFHELALLLKKRSIKVTSQRRSILQALLEVKCPATIDEIHAFPATKKLCNLTTVYRTLNLLKEEGIVGVSQFGDGFARFELLIGGAHHHHHVLCRICKKVQALDFCLPEKYFKELQKRGFQDVSHSLEFFATCADCATNSRRKA